MLNTNDFDMGYRRTIAVGLLAFVVLTAVVAGFYLAKPSPIEADLKSSTDSSSIRRTTQMSLNVTNNGESPIEPRVNVIHSQLQTRIYWKVVEGPSKLSPKESAVYVVQSPTPSASIPFGSDAVVTINHNGSQEKVKIGPTKFESKTGQSPPRIVNPDFEFWTLSETSYQHPFGWNIVSNNPANETTRVKNINGSVNLFVDDQNIRDSGSWTVAGVGQTSCIAPQVHIEATPQTVVNEPTTGPTAMTGLEIAEGDHRATVVFADIDERAVRTRTAGNLEFVYIYIPAESGKRVETTINLLKIYESQGWPTPTQKQVTVDGMDYRCSSGHVLPLAATYPQSPEQEVEVTFHRVNMNGSWPR